MDEERATRGMPGGFFRLTCVVVWAAGACGPDAVTPPASADEPGPTPAVDSIWVAPPERAIGVLGTRFDVGAEARADDGTIIYSSNTNPAGFAWSSSSPDVARLGTRPHFTGREIPVVTGVSEGTATITATSQGVTGSMTVNVRDRARLQWSAQAGRHPTGTGSMGDVAVGADGTIYVGADDPDSNRSVWYALSPQGSILWTRELPLTWFSTAAIGDDGTLYLGSKSTTGSAGRLIAVDPSGTVRWMLQDLDEIWSAPAIGADGTIYVAAGRHVYAVDPEGEILWTYETADAVFGYSSPALASDGTIYVGGKNHLLYAINPDGSLRWTFETGDILQSSPSIGTSGTVYFGSMDGRLYAVNPDGTERWSVELDWRGISSSPSIGPDGTIYIGAGGVFAVDPSGSIRWNYAPSNWVSATPILGADGTVYIGACCGITALDAQGELLWGYGTGGHFLGSPAIGVDGTIIAASFSGASADVDSWEGTVHAIVETSSANGSYDGSPWPTARGDRANTGRAGG